MDFIINYFGNLLASITFEKVIKPIFAIRKLKIVKNLYLGKDFNISQLRKDKIKIYRDQYEKVLKENRRIHLTEMEKNQQQKLDEGINIFKQPAWKTISTTSSDVKYRLVLGFHNKGCQYWRDDENKIGCLHCSYGSSAIQIRDVTKEELRQQFSRALTWALKFNLKFDVIEFLNDGSFFNFDDEFPDSFPSLLFSEIRNKDYIKRILIESRPEHITSERIELLLSKLAPDQCLEIGIGLETRDDFIRDTCIRKGYGISEFVEAIKIIKKYDKIKSVVVYTLIKPAFINEKEAVLDVIETIKYLFGLSKKYKIEILPKLEPAVIAQGSILEILHFNVPSSNEEYYHLLSYWSIVEILCRAYLLNYHKNIRIGAREDMEIIEKVPAIYKPDGTFNQYDFWIYDSIQQYNADNNIIRLLYDVKTVIDKDKESSYEVWKNKIELDKFAIEECINLQEKKIHKYGKIEQQINRDQFLQNIFNALDTLELDKSSQNFANKFKSEFLSNIDEEIMKRNLTEFINEKLQSVLGNDYEADVNMFYFEKDNRQMLRIYFQLFDLVKRTSRDMWAGIPTI